jgi:hypothetical protein
MSTRCGKQTNVTQVGIIIYEDALGPTAIVVLSGGGPL